MIRYLSEYATASLNLSGTKIGLAVDSQFPGQCGWSLVQDPKQNRAVQAHGGQQVGIDIANAAAHLR